MQLLLNLVLSFEFKFPTTPPPSSSPPPWGRGRVYFLKLMGRCGWSLNKCQNLLPPFPHPLKKGCGQEKNMLTKQVCKSAFFIKRDSDTLQGPSQFHFHMGVTASSTPSPSLPSSSSLPLALLWLALRERIAPNTCNHIPS